MRPILMIENVKNLHDARYCAAVGIAMATFELDPASPMALSPAAVGEISAWLSGLECVGRFPELDPADLNAQAEIAQVSWVQIPLSNELALVAEIKLPIIFVVDDLEGALPRLQEVHARFPEALFLMDGPLLGNSSPVWNAPSLLQQCLLRYNAPDAIYQRLTAQGLKPYGFSLGNFSADVDGLLDYDACDEFIDRYQALELA